MSDFLRRAPFDLNDTALNWVDTTYASLNLDEKVAQLFVLISRGDEQRELDLLAALQPGGITRHFGADGAKECARLTTMQANSKVPMLVSADLEGSRMSMPFGTKVLNPLALAAIDDIEVTRQTSRLMAQEALALGVNWSFTPVLDINAAFRSAIVATRGFGADVNTIKRLALAQIEEFQKLGLAATAKHWPGEGYDDRDQHLVTTINPLGDEEWEATFGNLYRAAITAGVKSIMSAHIALPEYVRSIDPDAGIEAYRPASVSHLLNQKLLREELGFNGLIVSDASEMAGLGAWQRTKDAKAELIANGCDVILFSNDPAGEMAAVKNAVELGLVSVERLEDAVLRILGHKASLGLHEGRGMPQPDAVKTLAAQQSVSFAQDTMKRAPTLVKDVNQTLPLNLETHKRVLVISDGIISPLHFENTPFSLPDRLKDKGFEITMFEKGTFVNPDNFDLVLYLFGEETLLTRGRIFLDWASLTGNFITAMARHWHDVPTVMISFGYPYYLYDAPRVPTYINAYCTLDEMQTAVADLLVGNGEWNTNSPVDPFCGLEDARY